MERVQSAVASETMSRPAKDTEQITLRVPKEWLDKADALAKRMEPGGAIGRTDAFRAAVAKGFEAFEREDRLNEATFRYELGVAMRWGALSGIPNLVVGRDPQLGSFTLYDGLHMKVASSLEEVLTYLRNWKGSHLQVDDRGEVFNVATGEGIDGNGLPTKRRPRPPR